MKFTIPATALLLVVALLAADGSVDDLTGLQAVGDPQLHAFSAEGFQRHPVLFQFEPLFLDNLHIRLTRILHERDLVLRGQEFGQTIV